MKRSAGIYILFLCVLLLLPSLTWAEEAKTADVTVSAEPLWTEEMTTHVRLVLEDQDGFGQGGQLTAALGNGLEAAWERSKLPIWWHFDAVSDSTVITLTRKDGRTMAYAADHRDDAHGVTVFLSPDEAGPAVTSPIYMTDPDIHGRFGLYFGFDMVAIREIAVEMDLCLTLDRAPEWSGCGLCTGFYPLTDIQFSDGLRKISLPSPETGFLIPELPLEVFCSVTGRAFVPGEATFDLTDSLGEKADSLCVNADGIAVAKLDRAPVWAFDGAPGETFTLTQTTPDADGTTADRTVYLIRVGEGSHAPDGDGWTASRRVTLFRLDDGAETEMETVEQSFRFYADEQGSLILQRDADANLWAEYTNTYAAVGRATLHGSVRVQGRLQSAEAGEFTVAISEDGVSLGEAAVEEGGAFTLPALNYDLSDLGVHTYAVTQLDGGGTGIVYDTAPRYVTVTVTDGGGGILKSEENVEEILFINRYAAKGTLRVEVESALEGREARDGEFAYVLTDPDGKALAQASNEGGKAVLTCDFTSSDMVEKGQTLPLTITFAEPDTDPAGLVYDTHTEEILVTLTDDGHGTLTAEAEPKTVRYAHRYESTGSLELTAAVSLEGQKLQAGAFRFILSEGDIVLAEAANEADGTVRFPELSYTLSDLGKHTYTVSQLDAETDVFTVDDTVYTVTVDVTDGGLGALNVSVPDEDLRFVNRYNAKGSFALQAHMTLTGGDILPDQYLFALKDGDQVLAEAFADASGAITFDAIDFDLQDAGEKTLTVESAEVGSDLVTAENLSLPAVLSITDLGDGTLDISQQNTVSFAFTYAAYGMFTPEGTLSLTGRALSDGEIRYQVTENGEQVAEGVNLADGTIRFVPIVYERADIGTHRYQVRQASADPAGVSGEGGIFDLEVTVTDLGNGVLQAEETSGVPVHFVYNYEAQGVYAPEARVNLRDHALVDDQFTFEIVLDGRVIKTQGNQHTGEIRFYPFTYTLSDVGTHVYTMRQAGEDTHSITLDHSEHALEVTVSDNGDGTLHVETSGDPIVFENTYRSGTSLALRGSAAMQGRALQEGEMRFEVLRDGQLVSNGEALPDGSIRFEDIAFTLDDLRAPDGSLLAQALVPLTVRMAVPEETAGVVYDTAERHVTVALSDDGSGNMTAVLTEDSDPLLFACRYESTGSLEIAWDVQLTGKTLEPGEFSYQLAENGAVLQTASSDGEGQVRFTLPLTLADAGTHRYVITGQAGQERGVIYDTSSRTLTAHVTDDGMGHLSAETEGERTPFVNAYYVTGPLTVSARVTLEGRQLTGNEISLALYEGEKRIGEKRSDAEGLVRFDPITYTVKDVGEHRYVIRTSALSGGIENVTGEAEVLVKVLSDMAGNACAILASDEPVIGYRYTAEGSFAVSAAATVNGNAPGEHFFTYALYDGEDLLSEAQNGADGRIEFAPVALTLADAGQKTYTIRCVSEAPAGYLMDQEVRQAVLRVEDQGDGTLLVRQESQAVFSHRYTASGQITPTCTLTMTGRALKAGEVRFGLYDGETLLSESANDVNGLVTFTPVVFTEESAGTKALRIVRLSDLPNSVQWVGADSADVMATIQDNGDGTLQTTMTSPAFLCAYHAVGQIQNSAQIDLTGRAVREGEFVLDLIENGSVIDTAVCGADGKVSFKPIRTDESGAMERFYTLSVRTMPGSVSGQKSAEVHWTAADDGEGRLKWTCDTDPLVLSFSYTSNGQIEIPVKVETAYPLTGGEFRVALYENGARLDEQFTDETGRAVFTLAYTAETLGTHTYTVSQIPANLAGMTFDQSDKQLIVNATDRGDGTIECTSGGDSLVFVNVYEAAGSYTLPVQVVCEGIPVSSAALTLRLSEDGTVLSEVQPDAEGRAWFGPISLSLKDTGTHNLTVSAVSGIYLGMKCDPVPVVLTVTDQRNGTLLAELDQEVCVLNASYSATGTASLSFDLNTRGRDAQPGMMTYTLTENGETIATSVSDAEGRVTFDIPYTQTQTGKHVYTLTNTDHMPGIATDPEVYTIETLVKDDGTGNLITEVYLPEGGIQPRASYTAEGEFTLQAKVTLQGRPMEEGEFQFTMYEDGAVFKQTRNTSDGTILFDPIPMTLKNAGEHTYTVQQVETEAGGVSFDKNVWQVHVTVADAGDGTLLITSDQSPVFENVYAPEGSAEIVAYVSLTGRPLSEGSFTLDLRDENGALIQEKTNDANGTVRFDPISYSLGDVGAHRYAVSISATAEAGVIPEERTETVMVTVQDQGDGTLSAVIANNGPVFQNAFVASESLILRPRVVINGGSVEDDPLTLVLRDSEGNTIESIQAAEGVNAFSPIAFTQNDAGKHYVYVVACLETSARYTVDVQVEDNQDGGLSVSEVYTGMEGPVDTMLFVWERTVTLTIRSLGVQEELGYLVSLYLDDGELKGDYPCIGAFEGTLTSGTVLQIPADGEVTISGLPADTRYRISCVAQPRYREDTVTAEDILHRSGECEFRPEPVTVDFSVTVDGEEGSVDGSRLTLYADGTRLDEAFEQDGSVFWVRGLPAGSLTGGAIAYTAVYQDSDTLSVVYDAEDPAHKGAVNGSTIHLIPGASMKLRVRFECSDGQFEFRTVTATLYNEEGQVGKVTLEPDESGWVTLTGLERNHVYTLKTDPVKGYTVTYRNGGQYGNVTNQAYSGATITYLIAETRISKRTVALIGGGVVAVAAGTALAVKLAARHRRKKRLAEDRDMDI